MLYNIADDDKGRCCSFVTFSIRGRLVILQESLIRKELRIRPEGGEK